MRPDWLSGSIHSEARAPNDDGHVGRSELKTMKKWQHLFLKTVWPQAKRPHVFRRLFFSRSNIVVLPSLFLSLLLGPFAAAQTSSSQSGTSANAQPAAAPAQT